MLGVVGLVPVISHAEEVTVALQSDSGAWFSRCNNCQKTVDGTLDDTITVHSKTPTVGYAQFRLIQLGNGKIALKADTGKFVARCRGCIAGRGQPDFITVHVGDENPPDYAQFTPELLTNGKYALKADTGKYLARCNGCSPGAAYPDAVTVHASDPYKEAYAQWNIIPISFPTGSKIALQADTGTWFSRCNGCQRSVDGKIADTITVHIKGSPSAAYSQFKVASVNGKIALEADSGKFVARCHNCIAGGTKPDFVTVHVPDAEPTYAQWTPELLPNGRYGLRSDTNKYLARCNGCSPGASHPDAVTIHATNPKAEAYAQWNIIWIP